MFMRCMSCDNVQPDMGRGVCCESCGSSALVDEDDYGEEEFDLRRVAGFLEEHDGDLLGR